MAAPAPTSSRTCDPLWSAIALAVALAPLGVIAALDDRFRVAPVTAVILLLVPSTTGAGPIVFTGERILEIAIGGIVAVAGLGPRPAGAGARPARRSRRRGSSAASPI